MKIENVLLCCFSRRDKDKRAGEAPWRGLHCGSYGLRPTSFAGVCTVAASVLARGDENTSHTPCAPRFDAAYRVRDVPQANRLQLRGTNLLRNHNIPSSTKAIDEGKNSIE